MDWVPERQRREARPTGVLLLLFALFAMPMGTCGVIGVMKLQLARSSIVPVASAEDLETLPVGTYVSVDLNIAPPTPLYTLTDCGGNAPPPSDWRGYQIAREPHVIVYSKTPVGSPTARVVGQLCDADSPLMCELPDARMKGSLRAQRMYPGRLALINGGAPSSHLWEAALGLGVAGLCLAVFLLVAAFLIRAARQPGRVVLTRTLTLAHAPDHVRDAVRAAASAGCRIAEDSPARMCLLVGKPAAEVRLMGGPTMENVPLRIDLEFDAADAYRGTMATLTVRELIPSAAKVASQIAVDRAAEWVISIC